MPKHFNPLPRKEGDCKNFGSNLFTYCISIHSLVKRETCKPDGVDLQNLYFNPLPRKEGDKEQIRAKDGGVRFQSTPS